MLKSTTAGSSALAAFMAAIASLFVLCLLIAGGMAINDLLTSSDAVAAAGFVTVVVFIVGAMFSPIAAVLGWLLGLMRVPWAAWIVGPMAGAVIGSLIAADDEGGLWLIAAGGFFGLVNAFFFSRIEPTLRPQSTWLVSTGNPFEAADR